MERHASILCVGEILWDALPRGLFLGGAPFNVACHLHTLGLDASFASRLGDDRLGREVRRRLEHRGLGTDLLQVDPGLPTGFVEVELDPEGVAGYTFDDPSAWDALAPTEALRGRAQATQAIVFGSLAQRHPASRRTIRALLESPALKVFDVNFRPPYVDRGVVEASLRAADVVKLNTDELEQMGQWWAMPVGPEEAAGALARRFGLQAVCITRGAEGAALWKDGAWWTHPGYTTTVVDTVGAGDAFLAGLLYGWLGDTAEEAMLDFANKLGAFVASRQGATPAYPIAEIEAMQARRAS